MFPTDFMTAALIGGATLSQWCLGTAAVFLVWTALRLARASQACLSRELAAVRRETEALRSKMVSAEKEFRNVFGQNAVDGDLVFAYEQLRQSQQSIVQQERLRALGQMASGVAHDINNSLTPIIGYTDFLLEERALPPEESRKCLQFIRAAAGEISHTVDQVRQFYRGRDEEETLPPLDLNQLATEMIERTRPRWQASAQQGGRAIVLETLFLKGLPRILENESELREAISNLILNAVDAMPQGGTLTISTGLVDRTPAVETRPKQRHVCLEVRDTGVGMDEMTRQRCLEPFFTTKGPRGRGLGLAMVYGLVRRHEGAIEISSQPGAGTAVRLLFPGAT